MAQENTNFGDSNNTEYLFGFNLVESSCGELCHFGLVKTRANGSVKVIFLTKDEFYAYASGKIHSPANRKGVNFFEKYNIKYPRAVLNSLWKLRFKNLPGDYSEASKGWATYSDSAFYILSQPHQEILKKYGMNRLRDYIVGNNAFKLLKNLEDSVWINQYKSGTAAGPSN